MSPISPLFRRITLLYLALLGTVLVLSGLAWFHGNQTVQQTAALKQAPRTALQISYRLQAQTVAYELALNEYYSTVIDKGRYQEKVRLIQQAIEADLGQLVALPGPEYLQRGKRIQEIINEAEKFRRALDQALDERQRDWDAAREALYKINILSTQAIEVAVQLTQAASEQEAGIESMLAQQHRQSLNMLAIALVLLAAVWLARSGETLLRMRRAG